MMYVYTYTNMIIQSHLHYWHHIANHPDMNVIYVLMSVSIVSVMAVVDAYCVVFVVLDYS